MIPRRLYIHRGIIACPLHLSTGHAMIPRGVYTLGIIACLVD